MMSVIMARYEESDGIVTLATDWHVEPAISFYKDIYSLNWLQIDKKGLLKKETFDYYYFSNKEKPTESLDQLCPVSSLSLSGYNLYELCK